jgi:hypothetical protein
VNLFMWPSMGSVSFQLSERSRAARSILSAEPLVYIQSRGDPTALGTRCRDSDQHFSPSRVKICNCMMVLCFTMLRADARATSTSGFVTLSHVVQPDNGLLYGRLE